MGELTRVINNYLAINNKKNLTEEEALQIIRFVNEHKAEEENCYFNEEN